MKSMRLQIGLLDLKNTKQMRFCLCLIFYAFLKVLRFSKVFEISFNSSVAHAKIVKCALFYLNTVGCIQ